MKAAESASIDALGRILRRLSKDSGFKVDQFCEREGASRSTVFDLVRRLEITGLVVRNASGGISWGHRLVALVYSEFGVAALHGPALPICRELRDQTGCTVILRTSRPSREVLLRIEGFLAHGPFEARDTSLVDGDGILRARLEIEVPSSLNADQRRDVRVSLLAARAALLRHLGNGDGLETEIPRK